MIGTAQNDVTANQATFSTYVNDINYTHTPKTNVSCIKLLFNIALKML